MVNRVEKEENLFFSSYQLMWICEQIEMEDILSFVQTYIFIYFFTCSVWICARLHITEFFFLYFCYRREYFFPMKRIFLEIAMPPSSSSSLFSQKLNMVYLGGLYNIYFIFSYYGAMLPALYSIYLILNFIFSPSYHNNFSLFLLLL